MIFLFILCIGIAIGLYFGPLAGFLFLTIFISLIFILAYKNMKQDEVIPDINETLFRMVNPSFHTKEIIGHYKDNPIYASIFISDPANEKIYLKCDFEGIMVFNKKGQPLTRLKEDEVFISSGLVYKSTNILTKINEG